jgi:hypothetical protein
LMAPERKSSRASTSRPSTPLAERAGQGCVSPSPGRERGKGAANSGAARGRRHRSAGRHPRADQDDVVFKAFAAGRGRRTTSL